MNCDSVTVILNSLQSNLILESIKSTIVGWFAARRLHIDNHVGSIAQLLVWLVRYVCELTAVALHQNHLLFIHSCLCGSTA